MSEAFGVYLPRLGPDASGWEEHPRSVLLASAELASLGRHVCEEPGDAHVILFSSVAYGGLWMRDIVHHPLSRAYPDRVMVYSEADRPWPRIPGIYASVPRGVFSTEMHRSGPYFPFHHTFGLGDQLHSVPDLGTYMFLYSFVGAVASSPRLRARLMSLHDPAANLVDTSSSQWAPFYGPAQARRPVFSRYVASFESSAFIVCPRGSGVGSMRVYEAMMAGRPPVIISDGWVPPVGPKWEDFALLVPERRVRDLPAILRERQPDAERMGRAARAAWARWFAPDAIFSTVLQWCVELETTRASRARRRLAAFKQAVHPRQIAAIVAEARDPITPKPIDDLP